MVDPLHAVPVQRAAPDLRAADIDVDIAGRDGFDDLQRSTFPAKPPAAL